MTKRRLTAIEFFSGIGAFAYACRGEEIDVVAAFDQGQDANAVYEHNFGLKPNTRNLDSIKAQDVPEADIWWMSPPCTPYTVRGAQRDAADPRAQSLAHLIDVLADKLPDIVFVENVIAFSQSQMAARLLAQFRKLGYQVRTEQICPTQFGIPMKRPRMFVVARRKGISMVERKPHVQRVALGSFVQEAAADSALEYRPGMHLVNVEDPDSYVICFTSGYYKSYKASGSFIESNGMIRRFSPEEILALMGFGRDFHFPPEMDVRARWRLVGNSVDIRCIRHVLRSVERNADWVKNQHDSTTNR